MKVAVVGGGFLGSAVARALGAGTVVATRSGVWRDPDVPSGIHMHRVDLTDPSFDPGPLRECDALYIAVAPGGREVDRRALYVDGPARLLERTADVAWRRVVYVGSTSALPSVDGWVFENETRRPTTERGLIQRDAEDAVLHHANEHDVPALVLRLGGLYGPGRALGRLYRQRTEGPLAGDGNTPTNLIHLDDAVQASLAALAAPQHVRGIVHVVDDDHTSRRTMYAAVAASTGQPPLHWERPVLASAPPIGKRVSNLRLKQALGVRLRHPTHVVGL